MSDNVAAGLRVVAGLRAGDPQALREAYERHKQDVLAVAAAVLGRGGNADAWDVLHDVFVGLGRNGRGLKWDTNLRAYLTRAAANRARDWHKRTRRQAERIVAAGEMSLAGTPDVLATMARDEEAEALWRVVGELPEEQRVVVALRVWGDLGFREIGKQLSISENTAQSRYRYALEKLRRHFLEVER